MAQCILTQMLKKRNTLAGFVIDSAATSDEEIGNGIYPDAREKLLEKGIGLVPHQARRLLLSDYPDYDFFIGMDSENIVDMRRILNGDKEGKILKLLAKDVSDPWYTNDFEKTYRDLCSGCKAILERL